MKSKITSYISSFILLILGAIILKYALNLYGTGWDKFWLTFTAVVLFSLSFIILLKHDTFSIRISRSFVGLVFLYSGFVKAVDPLGSNYKFIDYFDAWGLHFMTPSALMLGILLSMTEFVIGGMLLFNVRSFWGSITALIFMIFFTPITFYLATQQQVSGHELVHDCGCFGDALILTNWQTFWKNIILLIPTVFLFIKRKQLSNQRISMKWQHIIIGLLCAFSVVVSWYGYAHLPIIDFRPYKIGTNIPKAMEIPASAPQPVYEYHLFYKNKKTGETKEFSLENYPKDSLWEFVDTKNVLVKEVFVPKITGFSINGKEGDITQEVLSDSNLVFMVVEYDLSIANSEIQSKLNDICNRAMKDKYRVLALSATVESQVEEFRKQHNIQYPFYSADPITLKTVIRSNPGLVLIKNGTVLAKWHYNDFPDYQTIIKMYDGKK